MGQRLVIIGAGMATAYLLQELGERDHRMQVTVVGDEPELCYNRVMLSSLLSGDSTEADLDMLRDVDGVAGVRFMASTRVQSVDLEARTVVTTLGEQLAWDKLVFATGASVARPRLIDCTLAGVVEMRSLEDTRRLREQCQPGSRALVLGGGLLGLEAAHGLNLLGYETTVVHRNSYLMNRQLDAEGGHLLRHKMEASGIRFSLDANLQGVESSQGRVSAATLCGGYSLPCDLLVLATGISPNATLAQQAGLEVDRGVLVDDHLGTSSEHVYALGECSQLGQSCFGLVAPIRSQAAVLARRLVGTAGEGFAFEDWPTQLKISGIEIFSAGEPGAEGDEIVLRDAAAGVYRRLVLRQGCLVSAVLVGDKREGTWYRELIRQGSDVSQIRSTLMFGKEVSEAVRETAQAA